MSGRQQKKARATVTLDEELVGRVKRRVGQRGVSAYLNNALRSELRHQAMREYLERAEREHGPIPEEVRDAVHAAIEAGYEKVDRIRNRRRGFSALVKTASPPRKGSGDSVRRATALLEEAFGSAVSVEPIGNGALVVRLSDSDPTRRTK